MSRLVKIRLNQRQRRLRTRRKLQQVSNKPRLNVAISNKHIRAQVIDPVSGQILASASTLKHQESANLTQQAKLVGQNIAKKCQKAKIKKITLDRRHKLYHGRLKALAEAARQAGLEF